MGFFIYFQQETTTKMVAVENNKYATVSKVCAFIPCHDPIQYQCVANILFKKVRAWETKYKYLTKC